LKLAKLAGVLTASFLGLGAGSAWAVECTTIPGNLAQSCGFESVAEVADWDLQAGSAVYAAGLGENGGAMVANSQDFSGTHVFATRSACIPASSGQQLNLGYSVILVAGSPPSCTAGWQQWSDAACTVGNGGAIGLNPQFPDAGFFAVSDSRTVSAGTAGFQMIVDCRSNAAFQVRLDNAFIVGPLVASPTVPVPALGAGALGLLALALAGVATRRLRFRAR